MYARLIKPNWGKPQLRKKDNPDFIREIEGKNVVEGEFSEDELKELNTLGYNVYFFPNTFKDKDKDPDKVYLSGKDITVFKYAFIDMDLKDGIYKSKEEFIEVLSEFQVTPTMIVDSGNGVHAYWEMEGLDINLFMSFQMRLIQKFKTDHSVWTPLQLMRLPGYNNTKDLNNFKPAHFVLDTNDLVKMSSLDLALPKITEDNSKKIQKHLDKLNGIAQVLAEITADIEELPERFIDILESKVARVKHLKELFHNPVETCGDRSTADFKLINMLWKHHEFDYNELMQVANNSKKALSRNGHSRIEYAAAIVYRAISDNPDEKYDISSVTDRKRLGDLKEQGQPVRGPDFWDYPVLKNPWRKGQVLGMIAGPGIGKCHGINTPIMLHNGAIKKVQDIKVGDKLMGDDSLPREVLSLARGRESLYKITPVKGDSYIVNESHILSLQASYSGRYKGIKKGDIIDIPLKEYLKKPKTFKRCFKGFRVGVSFEGKTPDLDPRILGLWLGDGTSVAPEITTMDAEIKETFDKFCKKYGLKLKIGALAGKAITYRCTGNGKRNNNFFRNQLKTLNLINNKHIPQEFKTANRNSRLQLLAGLLDSDGHLISNCFEITQKSERLANDILFLCRSLGFAAYSKKVKKRCVNTDSWGDYYRMHISGEGLEEIPTLLERKKAAPRKQKKSVLRTGISVEKLEIGDYYGFTIDGNHRYLLGDFTVTHNTSATLKMFKEMLLNNPDNKDVVVFFTLEMPDYEIIERWDKLTKDTPKLSERLYVVSNEDEEGNPRHINLQDIVGFCKAIKRKTGSDIASIAIDHIGVLSPEINLTIEPNFGVHAEPGKADLRYMGIETICAKMKELAKMLDVFVIVQSQTTKDKAGGGDVPLGCNAAFGTARFEWYMDYVLTFWQPLYRVQSECDLTVLAFQYGKIRAKAEEDQIKTYDQRLLHYDLKSGDLRILTPDENSKANYQNKVAQGKRTSEKDDKDAPDFKYFNPKKISELLDNK